MRKFLRVTALWILLLPYLVTFVGAASNQLVLFANDDKFPVMANPIKIAHFVDDPSNLPMLDDTHCVMTKDTHLNLLADIFDFHDATMSIGDLLLDLGEWLSGYCFTVWFVVVVMKLKNTN